MVNAQWPTFGDVLRYLTDLGFVTTSARPGYVACRHPDEGSWFVFREQTADRPAREIELLDVRAQLTGRGFVTDGEFARFWDRSSTPAAADASRA